MVASKLALTVRLEAKWREVEDIQGRALAQVDVVSQQFVSPLDLLIIAAHVSRWSRQERDRADGRSDGALSVDITGH